MIGRPRRIAVNGLFCNKIAVSTYLVLTQHEITLSQSNRGPHLLDLFSRIAIHNAHICNMFAISVTELARGHANLKDIDTSAGNLRKAHTPDLTFDGPTLELVRKLCVAWVQAKDIPRLRLLKRAKERVKCRAEFACYTRTTVVEGS